MNTHIKVIQIDIKVIQIGVKLTIDITLSIIKHDVTRGITNYLSCRQFPNTIKAVPPMPH